MGGAQWWVVCALVLSAAAATGGAGSGAGGAAPSARHAAERHLLALLGLERRPPAVRARRPPVPPAMRLLYDRAHRAGAAALPRGPANTVRSFTHRPSNLDHRFPHEHRFRLFFNLTGAAVPPDELARGADLVLQRSVEAEGAQRLLVYDVVRPGRKGKVSPVLALVDSIPLRDGQGAVTADVLSAARRWIAEPSQNHGLLIRVIEERSHEVDAYQPHVRVRRRAAEPEESWERAQPLLLLYTEDARARDGRTQRLRQRRAAPPRRRQHRPHHRRKEAREACQRRPLFVDFADVGWSDWIVAPQGYDAYYCHGDCPFPLADHLNGTNHAIVQTLVNSVNPAAVPKACCVPTQLSSISMLYMDEVNNVVLKNYQDMAVVGCGCR